MTNCHPGAPTMSKPAQTRAKKSQNNQGFDPTFGEDGVAYDFSLPGSNTLDIVARLDEGKILMWGSVRWEDRLDFQLVQLLENGTLDTGFANNGIFTGGFKDGAPAFPSGAQRNDDGSIILIGTHYGTDAQNQAILRLLSDGTRDQTFGDDGVVIVPPIANPNVLSLIAMSANTSNSPLSNVAIGPDGAIVFTSWTLIQKFSHDGSPDLSFNGSGSLNTNYRIAAVAVSNDGKITIAGSTFDYEGLIARYHPNGTPDQGFGQNGEIRIRVDGVYTGFSSMMLNPDGSVIVAGSRDLNSNDVWGRERRGVIAFYNANGSPNLVFNGGKPVVSEAPTGEANAWSAIGGNTISGIVVAGLLGLRSYESSLVARYDVTGKPDTTFGTAGFQETNIGYDRELWESVVVQPDNKIIASGNCRYQFNTATVVRYLATNNSV